MKLDSWLQYPAIDTPGQPLLAASAAAGFPSPADDYCEERLSLDAHLVEHREATFFVRVKGASMDGFGIHDGDLLVVDRALDAQDRSIVIAVIDGAMTIKQLCRLPAGVLLRSGNPACSDIFVGPEQELLLWGVVRWSIHKVGADVSRR